MGVYIRGMEMPTEEYGKMVVTIYPNGSVVEYLGDIGRDFGTAMPVPPHGRLIDKDVMCNECRRIAEEYDGIYPDCTYCPAHLAPTIIPAEEDE